MTNREYIQSLPDEEFEKYIDKRDLRESEDWARKPCVCDYKREFRKRCDAMNNDCRACMLDFLRAEHIDYPDKRIYYAVVNEGDPASSAVLEFGFKETDTLTNTTVCVSPNGATATFAFPIGTPAYDKSTGISCLLTFSLRDALNFYRNEVNNLVDSFIRNLEETEARFAPQLRRQKPTAERTNKKQKGTKRRC